MAWIESHQELVDHPKMIRCADTLDIDEAAMIGYLHMLWWWALSYADDGNLDGFSPKEVARGARWPGEPQEFLDALEDAGFLNGDQLHDWWDYAGKLVERRQKDRERKRKSPATPPDVRKTSTGTPAEVQKSAYVPNPTVPNPTQPDSKNGGKPPRIRDELWDVFVGIHGDPASKSERGKFNKILHQLREADVSAAEYPTLVAAYVSKYNGTQPAAATVAQRVGEMRNYAAKGPMQAPDPEQLRREQQWAQVLDTDEQGALP